DAKALAAQARPLFDPRRVLSSFDVSSVASSSEFSLAGPASVVRILPVFPESMSRHSGDSKAVRAVSTAPLASCLDALGTSAIISPLDGSMTDDLAPVELSFQSPPTSIFFF